MKVKIVRVHVNNDPPVVFISGTLVNDAFQGITPLKLYSLLKFFGVLALKSGDVSGCRSSDNTLILKVKNKCSISSFIYERCAKLLLTVPPF